MKHVAVFAAVLVAVAAPASRAQQGGMGGMDMKDHQGMDMGKDKKSGAKKSQAHKGTGVVKNVDAAGGKVTIAHGPIPSINWPAMSMAFSVKDKKMLEKLAPEKKVEFQFEQHGSDYVITSIK